jgi:hypothetical protein
MKFRHIHGPEPGGLGHVLHRSFKFTDTTGDEGRLVTDAIEFAAEVRDMKRRSPDIESSDDAQDANRLEVAHHAPMLAAPPLTNLAQTSVP